MIKNLFLLLFFTLSIILKVNAQDTSAYEIQRAKINELLAERSAKFGQYDNSLNARTGIFGFQTKKDIKNSNEILRQIALNDNAIFTELKVLMDYKDLQVEQVKTAVNTNTESIQNYRKTIKDLQTQNQKLTNDFDKIENGGDLSYLFVGLLLISCLILAYTLYNKNKLLKQYENASV